MNGIAPKRIDWVMVSTLLLLLTISTLFIYSAQFQSIGSVGSTWQRQLIFSFIGLLLYFTATWFDYRKLIRLAPWIYPATLLLLLLVFLFPPVNGAHRWIALPGFTLQPSELAKPAALLMLAAYLAAPDRDRTTHQTFLVSIAILLTPLLLIALEPDLSSALVIIPAALAILLYTGIKRKWLLSAIGTLLLATTLLCGWIKYEAPTTTTSTAAPATQLQLPPVPLLEPYQKERIRVFLSDEVDSADAGWNKLQAQVAVGSGGFRGKGYLQGSQNILGFLPRTVAPTDFIFCVIAEEMGFIGSLSILLLYTLLLGRCLRTAWRAPDEFGRMVALGISTLLFCHIFINIAMTIGLLPITGLPLPLMSYGGSFMISTMVALGIIQSIYQRRRIR
jgi:rod shape determining protein RodA